MDKNECVESIKRFFNQRYMVTTFLGGNLENFRISFNTILQHIEKIENNEEIDDYDKTPVINSINFLKKVVDGSIVDVEQLNFVTNWCLFVFNWNNNVLKDKYLEKDIIYIQRATKQNHTINEVHEILNRLSKEMKKYINSNPPAFEVAKHYINYLEE